MMIMTIRILSLIAGLLLASAMPAMAHAASCDSDLTTTAPAGLGSRSERYFSQKLAYDTLYEPQGAAPIDEPLINYFPRFINELSAPEASQAAPAVVPDQLEVSAYIAGAEKNYVSNDEFQAFRSRVIWVGDLRREKTEGRTGSAAFKRWLPDALELYRNKGEMERLLGGGKGAHTFRTFFDVELRRRFDESGYLKMNGFERCVFKSVAHPALHVPLLATWRVARFVAAGIAGVAIFSTCQNTWNSFTGAPQAVVTQKAAQVGAELFTPVTNGLQFLVINASTVRRVVEKQSEVKTLEAALDRANVADLAGQPAEVAEKELSRRLSAIRPVAYPIASYMKHQYAEFSDVLKMSVELRTQEGAFLGADQSGGRGIFWSQHLFMPQDLAFRISGFETNYNTHELLIQGLQTRREKLVAQNADAAALAQIDQRIASHEVSKEVAMKQAASTLALLKLAEFLYPELFAKSLKDKDHQIISGAYQLMKQRYGYDHYLRAFDKHSKETVSEIHRFLSLRRTALEKAMGTPQRQ